MAGHKYDRFDLPFLRKENGRIYNDTFDVTDTTEKLKGVFNADDTVDLKNYLVYRPIPQELLDLREIPNVHVDSPEMEEHYTGIVKGSFHGRWIDGEYWNPLMIYWVVLYVFPAYRIEEGTGKVLMTDEFQSPLYCSIDRYILDLLWLAMLNTKDFAIMGSRGIGKSVLMSCPIDRAFRLYPRSWSVISSTTKLMTAEAWNKVEESMRATDLAHPALKHKLIKDSEELKLSGEVITLPDGTSEHRGYRSKIERVIYANNSGASKGKRPHLQLIEEFAAFPPKGNKGSLLSCMGGSRGSWYIGGEKKGTVMYAGTGGSVENEEAEAVFMDPAANDMIPNDDWKHVMGSKSTGCFIPVQLKKTKTWETYGTPDIALAIRDVKAEREAKKGNPEALLLLIQEFPMTPEEMFMRRGSNIFNQDRIASQRTRIDFGGDDTPKIERGDLNWIREKGEITGVRWSSNPYGDFHVLEHPVWSIEGSKHTTSTKGVYIGGCDSIDQGNAESSFATDSKKGSELSVLIKKRVVPGEYFNGDSNIYVAYYNKRSDYVVDDWDNACKLAKYYESQINLEFTKTSIIGHFKSLNMLAYLKKRVAMNTNDASGDKESKLIGTTAGNGIIDYQDQLVMQYINDNCDRIWFPKLLMQLQIYNRNHRTPYDLVIAMGLCELADEDLIGKKIKTSKPVEEFEDIGFYRDPATGMKKWGVIPRHNDIQKNALGFVPTDQEEHVDNSGVVWKDHSQDSRGRIV